jgi:activator of HSP90 ATPase
MAKTIVQKVVFKNTTPKALYELYMDAKLHSKVTGGPAKISKKVGSSFSAHGDYITGKNLHLIENKLIVQTWRGKGWDKNDVDSLFSIHLEQKGKDVVLNAVHANLPESAVAGVNKGWHDHYWKPWKQHLAGKTVKNPKM